MMRRPLNSWGLTQKPSIHCHGLATGTAGVAGILVGMTFTFYPHTGPEYLIIAFGVVIVGGLGSLLELFWGG